MTNWDAFKGGQNAPIKPLLPQSGSGLGATFLAEISVSTPGVCVTEPSSLEENEGTNPVFRQKDAADEVIPISAGMWVAQAYHSARCGQKPTGSQNKFGCDANGVLGLNDINGTSPTVGQALNPKFTETFVATLFNVVRTATTADDIPAYLEPFLGVTGSFCTQPSVIRDYGFEPTASCG